MANTVVATIGSVPRFQFTGDDPINGIPATLTIYSDDGTTALVITGQREAINEWIQQIYQAFN